MRLEDIANHVSDRDAEWWPFLFMRPAQEKKMSSLRVLCIAALYGIPGGAFTDVWMALSGGGARVHPLLVPLLVTAALFLLFRVTVAVAWNRRAVRLSR